MNTKNAGVVVLASRGRQVRVLVELDPAELEALDFSSAASSLLANRGSMFENPGPLGDLCAVVLRGALYELIDQGRRRIKAEELERLGHLEIRRSHG